jgi:hypothetical protein
MCCLRPGRVTRHGWPGHPVPSRTVPGRPVTHAGWPGKTGKARLSYCKAENGFSNDFSRVFTLRKDDRISRKALVANLDQLTMSLFIVRCFLNSNSNRKIKLNRRLSFNTIHMKMRAPIWVFTFIYSFKPTHILLKALIHPNCIVIITKIIRRLDALSIPSNTFTLGEGPSETAYLCPNIPCDV